MGTIYNYIIYTDSIYIIQLMFFIQIILHTECYICLKLTGSFVEVPEADEVLAAENK